MMGRGGGGEMFGTRVEVYSNPGLKIILNFARWRVILMDSMKPVLLHHSGEQNLEVGLNFIFGKICKLVKRIV